MTELRDSTGNTSQNQYQYDIWGGLISSKETKSNPFLYSGEYWDSSAGLQYLRARWYDPSVGRFINEDPYQGKIINPLSLNLYTYVENNPLTRVDPSGHVFETLLDVASIGWSAYSLYKDPSWSNTGYLAWDVTAALVPFVPGSYVAKAGEIAVSAVKNEKKVVEAVTTVKNACHCFVAGTKVLTDEGEKPIEEIEVGDKVLAKDDETGEMAYKEVEWLFQRDVKETYNITVGGEVITTTDEHPFWIIGKGWVESKNLVVGDVLTTSDGKELAIEKIEVKQGHATVYNFKVKDFHTYFVSNLGIWTHNACSTPNTTTKWDIKTNAKAELTYNFHGQKVKAYQDSNGYWWAKDTTGHGCSAYKVFEKKGKELHWKADADEYGNWITDKHKSQTGTVIKLN
ncbi:polymorphic toxin-type HINT domain-containing protein [Paenibacillus sp. D51F]